MLTREENDNLNFNLFITQSYYMTLQDFEYCADVVWITYDIFSVYFVILMRDSLNNDRIFICG